MVVEKGFRISPVPLNLRSSLPARCDNCQRAVMNITNRRPLRPLNQQHLRGAAALFPAAIAANPFSILILSFSSCESLGFFSSFGTGFVIGSELSDAAVDLEPKHMIVGNCDVKWVSFVRILKDATTTFQTTAKIYVF